MNLNRHLKWRYATKNFDPTRKITSDYLDKIKKAVQLSASSYGLQLYKVLIIEDESLRQKLKPASWEQHQITDASHLVVFCSYTDVKDRHIDEYLQLKAVTEGIDLNNLDEYGDFIKEKIHEKSEDEQFQWMSRQTYLALGNLLAACAELKIDACPMEGFESEKYNEILGLSERGLNATVLAAIGYRIEDDPAQKIKKIRKPMDILFEEI